MAEKFTIRRMIREDFGYFVREECAQGWHSTEDKFLGLMRENAAGNAETFVGEIDGVPAGYVSLFRANRGGAMAEMGWPEIVDLNVLEKFRCRGVGNFLMQSMETLAAESTDCVRIGVGLHAGYGSAQRMYVKRGYIPDGSGVWYGDKVCEPYADCVNDDDLVLYLYKKLR